MRIKGSALLAPLAAWLLAAGVTAAAAEEAPAKRPLTLEEMLKVCRENLAGGTTRPGPRPSRRDAEEEIERYKPASEAIKELEKKINRTFGERKAEYIKFKRYWPEAMLYYDTQHFQESGTILVWRFIEGRAPKRQQYVLDSGEVHREAAKVMARFEHRQELAEKYAEEAGNRATSPHLQRLADGSKNFVANYKKNREELDKWEVEFAKKPGDADLRWKIADSYRRKVQQYLDEIFALQDVLDRFPDHGQVKSGEVKWRLAEGYSRYHLFDEATAMYIHIDKEYPKYRQVTGGECWWRAGQGLRRQKKWKEARAYYQRILKSAPKHHANRLRQNQTKTTLQSRIEECNRNID